MIKKLIAKIKQNPILKNILLLFTGTGLSQIIPTLASLILSRLFLEKDYGDLSILLSISGIVGVIATFRYELAIMLPKKNNDARNLFSLSLLSTIIISFIFFILVLILSPYLKNRIDISNYNLIYLTPIIILGIGFYNSFDNWFNRLRAYKIMVISKIAQSIATSLIKVILGLLGISIGLVLGTIWGYIIVVLMFVYLFIKVEPSGFFKAVSFKKMKIMVNKYKDFSLYSTPSALFNSLSNIGLPLLIGYFYSVEMAGIYYFSYSMIRLPITLLSTAVAQVYKKEASYAFLYSKEKLLPLTFNLQKMILLCIIPILIIFSIWGKDIFAIIFGERWVESGNMIKYYAVFILLNSNFSPISSVTEILRKQKLMLFFNISLVFFQVILMLLFANNVNFNTMILMISISGAIHFLLIDLYIKKYIKKHFLNIKS